MSDAKVWRAAWRPRGSRSAKDPALLAEIKAMRADGLSFQRIADRLKSSRGATLRVRPAGARHRSNRSAATGVRVLSIELRRFRKSVGGQPRRSWIYDEQVRKALLLLWATRSSRWVTVLCAGLTAWWIALLVKPGLDFGQKMPLEVALPILIACVMYFALWTAIENAPD